MAPPPPPDAPSPDAPSSNAPSPNVPIPVGRAPTPEAASEEVQVELEGLRQRVRRRRRRSAMLGYGTVAAVLLGLICGGTYYVNAVLSYAKVQDVGIARDPIDPNRVILSYRPTSDGTIGFRRRSRDDCTTELLDQVMSDAVGDEQTFQWRISGLEAGEVIEVVHLRGWSRVSQSVTVPERPPRTTASAPGSYAGPALGKGALSGQVVDATNNQPVVGAEVRIAGTPLSVLSDFDGNFRIEGAPTGVASIEISANEFATDKFRKELFAGEESYVRVVLNPGMEEGQIRLVLTWDRQPEDLDAHLEGPLPDGETFHVHYDWQGDLKANEFVRLDVDDRNGEGPETITVLGVQPGTYRYYVHDYSNADEPESTALAQSGAEVRLYQGGQTYRFRAGHEMVGNVWNVCTIEVTDDRQAVVKKVDEYQGAELAALGLYEKRTQANRTQWLGNLGGTAISETAVTDGLQWLARHQALDGSWTHRCLGNGTETRCEKPDLCSGAGDAYEAALSGLALLAFQAGGHYYFNDSQYSETVRRGLDWMVENQQPDGALVGSKRGKKFSGEATYHQHHMYEHGIAAFALADACAAAAALYQPENERYMQALEKAVAFIEKTQHLDGGWRYTDDLSRPGDSSVSGWQVLALKSAKEAGVAVSNRCVENTRTFFERRDMHRNGQTGYTDDQILHTDATTGVGMLARQFLLDDHDAPLIADAAEHLAREAEMKWGDPRGKRAESDYYLWYNCTLGMFQVGGPQWDRWNTVIRDTLVALQEHEGCERGSWEPESRWGDRGGRIYTTALAILTLEVYYRYTRSAAVDAGDVELNVAPGDDPPTGVPVELPVHGAGVEDGG